MANSPYEVLGVREGADFETVKKAYRELVRKYHPDQYSNHPLSDLAEEKLKEINHAYDEISKRQNSENNSGAQGRQYSKNQGSTQNSNKQSAGYQEASTNFSEIRQMIFNNRIQEAEKVLDFSNIRNAEWYYLKGLVFSRKGWYNEALQSIQTAVNLEPSNYEYRQALNQMAGQNNNFNNMSYARRGGGGMDMCQMCQCLICADCCCDGGMIDCF